MNADKIFMWIMVAILAVWMALWYQTVHAEGFTQQAPQEYHPYFYDYYQQPAQRNRREERRVQRQEREDRYQNDQQPIVGGGNKNQVWDTNPKQINGGQGHE